MAAEPAAAEPAAAESAPTEPAGAERAAVAPVAGKTAARPRASSSCRRLSIRPSNTRTAPDGDVSGCCSDEDSGVILLSWQASPEGPPTQCASPSRPRCAIVALMRASNSASTGLPSRWKIPAMPLIGPDSRMNA